MPQASLTQPFATTYRISDLVPIVLEGQVRVPEFQRPLRWQQEDVRRLFDSILRGYPIGSVLLWSRPAEAATLRLGALEIDAPARSDALWVVDGQQRITSLACALTDEGAADPRFSLAYDLGSKCLARPDPASPEVMPLPVLFDLQRLLKWFAAHPETSEHLDEATRVAKIIREYTLPAYVVRQDDEDVLRDIFDRMNNFGRRLSRAEVFTALHSRRAEGGRPRGLDDIASHLDARFGFGVLDDDTVLRAILARYGPDPMREFRGEFESAEAASEAFLGGERALEKAVAFLQEDARVPHRAFLAYKYLLVVLARFFAHHPDPEPRNRELLRRFYWRAALVGPTVARGVYTTAMRSLANCVDPTDESGSVQALLAELAEARLGAGGSLPFRFPSTLKVTMAEARFVLCALWDLGPRSPSSGEVYDRDALASALGDRTTASDALERFFPRARVERNAPGNRVILLGDDLSGDARALFLEPTLFATGAPSRWGEVLASHALDEQSLSLLAEEHVETFIERRDARIEELTRRFLERMAEMGFEDTPPLDALDLDDESDEPEEAEHGGLA